MNEKKKGFLRLRLLDRVLHNEVNKVPVLYEGRLTRFGFDTLKDAKPPQQELVEDLIATISNFLVNCTELEAVSKGRS